MQYKLLKDYFDKDNQIKIPNPQQYIEQLCIKLKLGQNTFKLAQLLCLKIIERKIMSGENPATVGACLVKTAMDLTGEHMKIKDLSTESKTCQMSIRVFLKKVNEQMKDIIESLRIDHPEIKKEDIAQFENDL